MEEILTAGVGAERQEDDDRVDHKDVQDRLFAIRPLHSYLTNKFIFLNKERYWKIYLHNDEQPGLDYQINLVCIIKKIVSFKIYRKPLTSLECHQEAHSNRDKKTHYSIIMECILQFIRHEQSAIPVSHTFYQHLSGEHNFQKSLFPYPIDG